MSDLVKIELPFAGFYESIHSEEIDRALEDGFNYDYETGDEKEVPDIWGADYDYNAICREYCKEYTEAFGDKFGLDLTFDDMWSPREYNFSTDRIFALVPRDQINKIRKEAEAHDGWGEYIKERFTSSSGFHSFYSSDYRDVEWTRELLDECQYEVILQYWLENISDETGTEGWYMEEVYMVQDFEMCNWDSIVNAHRKIEEYLREEVVKDAVNGINTAIDWLDNEFLGEHNMPSYAYEAVQELKEAIKKLEGNKVKV